MMEHNRQYLLDFILTKFLVDEKKKPRAMFSQQVELDGSDKMHNKVII